MSLAMLSVEKAEKISVAMELPDWVMEKAAVYMYACFGGVADAFEIEVKTRFPHVHNSVRVWIETNQHPFAARLPYLNPWHVMVSVMSYLALVLAFRLFGRFLGKFTCRLLGLVHNFALHLLSFYMSFGLMVSARAAGYSLWNNAAGTSPADWRLAKLIWLFYVSKVIEWMDTVIMLLKQNYHQVSFLHLYHHTTIFGMWWLASLVGPGGEAYYSAMVNSSVHVVMYGYYFLTLLFPSGTVRHVLNKFKFVITKGQMTQFTFNCLQSGYDLVWVPRAELKYSAPLLQSLFLYMISLLALFGNFLVKNRSKASRQHPHRHLGHSKRVEMPTVSQALADGTPVKTGMTKAQMAAHKSLLRRRGAKKGSVEAQNDTIRRSSAQPINVEPIFRH